MARSTMLWLTLSLGLLHQASGDYYDDIDNYEENQYDNLYDDNADDMDSLYNADDDYYYGDEADTYDAYDDEAYDEDDFNIEDYADLIDQIDDPTLLQFIFEFGDKHHYDSGDSDEHESPAEMACAKEHDKDGNGVIDETEMFPFLMCLKGATGGYDGNGDHSVSPQELKCGMAVDKNHNGKIDKEEMPAYEACLGISKKTKKKGLGFDADGDGKVSSEEAACGKIVDKNGNGVIDEAEKKAFHACIKGAKKGYDANGDGKVSAKELRCGMKADIDHSGVIDKSEIAVFKKCMGGSLGFDANGDGHVSAEEAACGKLVDKNGNGKIDANEKKAFADCLKEAVKDKKKTKPKKKGHIGHAGFDMNGDGKVSAEELRCGLQADKDKSGKIDKSEIEEFKRCMAHGKKGPMKKKVHLGYDANGDGVVSPEEAACGKLVDKNGNGIIDEAESMEFNKCLKQKRAHKQGLIKPHHSGMPMKAPMHKDPFHVDFDGNGKVESHEKQFARLFDMNNDGKLSKKELERAKLGWKLARLEFSDKGHGAAAAAYDEYDADEYYDYDDLLDAYSDYNDDYYYDDMAYDDEVYGEAYDDDYYMDDYDNEEEEGDNAMFADYSDNEEYGAYDDEEAYAELYDDETYDDEDETYDDAAYGEEEYDGEYEDEEENYMMDALSKLDEDQMSAFKRLMRQQNKQNSYYDDEY